MIKNRKNTDKRWKCVQECRGHEIFNPQIRSTELHPYNRQISHRTSTRRGHTAAREESMRGAAGDQNTRPCPNSTYSVRRVCVIM